MGTQNIEGIISTTKSGVGFVPIEVERGEKEQEDVLIPRDKVNRALPGDRVRVTLEPKALDEEDRQTGEVTEILERAKTRYVGTLRRTNSNGWFLSPDARRMYTDINITDEGDQELHTGYKAVVEITSWNEGDNFPLGIVAKVIGPKGDHETEMQSIILDKGIIEDFPDGVIEEVSEFENWELDEKDVEQRRDLRNITTFTIDPESAKDFDDALSFEKLDNGNYSIGVHIADVSHFVRPETMLDKEARERAFSVYLVDRTIPMLPTILSNDLCSLKPEVDRLAFSAVFEMTPQGNVVDRWFGKTVIHSDQRFAYEDAQEILDNDSGEYLDELRTLNNIAQTLRNLRFSKGAINFHSEEVEFVLDDDMHPIAVREKEHIETHELVEEFMLLCNREVATLIHEIGEKSGREELFVYRVHGLPDRERLEELAVFLRALGYDFKIEDGEEVDSKDINALIKKVEGKAEEGLVNTALIRTMDKASYTITNKGHFGLAFAYYTHFTSPIRRYPDLLVHRLLERHLNGETIPNQEFSFYESATRHASEVERSVLEAERDSIKYKQVEFMEDKVDQEFTAIISGVSKHGLYVEEEETKANGMISVRSMKDDYYELDKKQYALVGKNSGKSYTLGDEVRVKLTKANLDDRELDFEMVDEG